MIGVIENGVVGLMEDMVIWGRGDREWGIADEVAENEVIGMRRASSGT
jgi:hypothetical protein